MFTQTQTDTVIITIPLRLKPRGKKDVKIMKLPYVKSLEKFKKPLQKLDTKLVFSYKNKLTHNLCVNKPKNQEVNNGVYEIPCNTCKKVYVGETGRDLKTRVKEHQKDIKTANENNAMFIHMRDFDHPIDFGSAKIVYPADSLRRRHIIESALIEKHRSNDNCVNLNKGFSPNNPLVSKYVRQSIKLLK